MLKNSKVVFISVTLKSWSGRKLLDPPTYVEVCVTFKPRLFYPMEIDS